MSKGQDLQVQEKRELQKKEETTIPARIFLPDTDIFEGPDSLTVVMEMPGVEKDNVNIDVRDNVLNVEGRIDFSNYKDLRPVYTEYNVGHYRRSFSLSSRIDQEKIGAEMKDGVLTITLPKLEAAKPRKIKIG